MGNNYNGSRWQERKDRLVLSKENYSRHNPMRSVLIYIYIYIYIYIFWIWLQVQFLFLQCFSLNSRSLSHWVFFLFYTIFFLSSPPSTCRLDRWCWSLSHQHLPEVFGSSCKTENHCSGITSLLMRPES